VLEVVRNAEQVSEEIDAETTRIGILRRMERDRNFPHNTCPSSRHVQMIAEGLAKDGRYGMIEDDPLHVAGSLATVVSHLYQARTFLAELGYTFEPDGDGRVAWSRTAPPPAGGVAAKDAPVGGG
jgi:hypothetical protein